MTTQKAYFSYEEVIDLHTESDRVSVIGIHTPTGDTPRKLCPGFFNQFRKYKYLGAKVALVPAAKLPADPLSVSYEAGEPTIDPRDMLNPILWHGCHGDDLGNILNRIYSAGDVAGSELSELLHSDSADFWSMFNNPEENATHHGTDLLESLYYRALTDKSWKKADIQRGFRIGGLRPRVYSLATNMYLQNARSLGSERVAPAPFKGEFVDDPYVDHWEFEDSAVNNVRYFTPRTVPLGWLDTRSVIGYVPDSRNSAPDAGFDAVLRNIVGAGTVDVDLPKIYMGIIMLPPAYKTEMYFRMIVNHYFAFAGFRSISLSNDMLENPNVFDWNEMITEGNSDPVPDPGPSPDPTPEYRTIAVRFKNSPAAPAPYGRIMVNIIDPEDRVIATSSINWTGAVNIFTQPFTITNEALQNVAYTIDIVCPDGEIAFDPQISTVPATPNNYVAEVLCFDPNA
nr:MAG: capsid protein [Virus sp.]